MNQSITLFGVLLALSPQANGLVADDHGPPSVRAVVEVEEDVYQYEPAGNGAGPMWCRGSTCLVRVGSEVLASGLETIPDAKPLNNCRWQLHRRGDDGWHLVRSSSQGRTREPCPLAAFADGRVFLSGNPTLTEPDAYNGPARPEILQFSAVDPRSAAQTILPVWADSPPFTEHSYRSFAADGRRCELILFQNIGYTHAAWAFLDSDGKWSAQGKLVWPWGGEYDRPQPVRVCYPTVALKDRTVYFCGVSDIIEPYDAWRQHKRKITGREWDYDFRRMFFTWSDDIASGKFHDWIEIASRDKTAGWITPLDLSVGPDGAVHLLWTERAIDTRLRDRFFPDQKQSVALKYAVVRGGRVAQRLTLWQVNEGEAKETPGTARFHVLPNHQLLVFLHVHGANAEGDSISENRLLEILPDGTCSLPAKVDLLYPLSSYFTATPRAGSASSDTLDLLGTRVGANRTMSYARIRFAPLSIQ